MQNLGVPVVHEAGQGSASHSSPQVTARQGQITGSNNETAVVGGNSRSSPSQQSHSPEQRRRLRNLNPEEDFASMSPEAQAAISQVSYGRPTAILAPAKLKRKQPRNLLKELEPFNKDPAIETDRGVTGLNLREAHNTRKFIKSLNKIGTSASPPGNLNQKSPDEEQPKGKRRSTRIARSTSNFGPSKSNEKRGGVFVTPTRSVSPRKVSGIRQDRDTAREEALRQRRVKAQGEKEWIAWRARKDQILNLLNLISNPKAPALDGPDEQTRRRLESTVPDGFNMFMEDDIYVFAPTAAELWNFQTFIAKVENIVGQKKGFMKIVLPSAMKSKYCPPHPTATASSAAELSFDGSSRLIRPNKTKLDRHQLIDSETVIYSVRMLGGVNVFISEWQEAMRKYQETTNQEAHNTFLLTPRNEKEMIAYSQRDSDDMYYIADLPECHSLRHALQLGGPYLRSVQGNRLKDSRLKDLGMDRSQIQLAGAGGSPFGLEMTDHAAYSLNYLHRGAPKRWLIIEPHAHKKLEELLHAEVESTAGRLAKKVPEGFKPPTHPPRCDQFLGHQPLYVPKESLDVHGISYTEIVQNEGEMVITFPFAYYQGFSEGPNIAEAIAYGNDGWETVYGTRLYRACHANCSGPKGCPDPGRAEFSEVDQPSHDHIREHVPEHVPTPGLEEYTDEDSPLTSLASTSSDTDARSDSEESAWEEPSAKKGKGIQKSATRKKPNKGVKASS